MTSAQANITANVRAKVAGADDVADLAENLAQVDQSAKKAERLDVTARVQGADKVQDLADVLGDLDDVDIQAAAKVSGERPVADLGRLVDGLPATTDVDVTADVTGADDVADLDTALAGLDDVTVTATASVAGERAVADLDTEMAGLTDQTVTVTAKVSDSGGVGDLAGELDDVRSGAGDASGELGAMGSEISGTLGGQFSEGTGMVADFGEQFGNLRQSVADAGGGIQAWGKALGGVAATVGIGVVVDAIVGDFERVAEVKQKYLDESESGLDTLTQKYYDHGDAIDAATERARIFELSQTETFQTLVGAGADWTQTMDALYKGDFPAYSQVVDDVRQNYANLTQEQLENAEAAIGAGARMVGNGARAEEAAGKIENYAAAQGFARDASKDSADAAYITADAMDDLGDAAKAAGTDVYDLDRTKLGNKTMALEATDKASPKVDAANRKKLNDKDADLTAHDLFLAKVDAANRAQLKGKTADLKANDYASGRVSAFNVKPISDKTADVDANTYRAERDIAALNGRDVSVDVSANLLGNAWDYLFGTRTFSVTVPTRPAGRAAAGPVLPDDLDEGRAGLFAAAAAITVPVLPGSLLRAALTPPPPTTVVTNTVTIQGAVDPVGTARQVRGVLTAQDRRMRSVRVGEWQD